MFRLIVPKFLIALLCLIVGLYFIINNKIIVLNLLKGQGGIFNTKIIEKREPTPKEIKDRRIFLCVMGGLIMLFGLAMLITP